MSSYSLTQNPIHTNLLWIQYPLPHSPGLRRSIFHLPTLQSTRSLCMTHEVHLRTIIDIATTRRINIETMPVCHVVKMQTALEFSFSTTLRQSTAPRYNDSSWVQAALSDNTCLPFLESTFRFYLHGPVFSRSGHIYIEYTPVSKPEEEEMV